MTKKAWSWLHAVNLVLLAAALYGVVYYQQHGGLLLKGITSAWFVLIGLINTVIALKARVQKRVFPCLITLGLVLGLCADVLLGVEFLLGVGFFALGHLMYLFAFYALDRPRLRDLLCILPLTALSLFFALGTDLITIREPLLKILLPGYAALIGCMLGKAVSLFFGQKNAFGLLTLLGCALFWFSDLMLAISMFGRGGRIFSLLCTFTYWPGQSILACALFHYARRYAKPVEQNP